MSNPANDAANDLERISVMFSGLTSLGTELRRVGSLKNLEQEIQGNIDRLKAEQAQHSETANQLAAQNTAATASIASQLNQAQADADAKVKAAGQQGAGIIASAKTFADKIKADVEDEKKAIADRYDSAITNAKAELERLSIRLTAAKSATAAAEGEAAAAKSKLDAANAQLQSLHAMLKA